VGARALVNPDPEVRHSGKGSAAFYTFPLNLTSGWGFVTASEPVWKFWRTCDRSLFLFNTPLFYWEVNTVRNYAINTNIPNVKANLCVI
jgi:hypothetical protein